MKKALAVALAVFMMATVAFALPLGAFTGKAGVEGGAADHDQIIPGDVMYFTIEDLIPIKARVALTDGWFDPAHNVVTVEYGKGRELVEKEGWVRVTPKDDSSPALEKTTAWEYQIAFKDSASAVYNKKNVDFVISKITVKSTGIPKQEYIFDGEADHLDKFELAYGWTPEEMSLDPSGEMNITNGFKSAPLALQLNTLYSMVATVNGKGETVASNTWFMKDHLDLAEFKVKAGDKVLRRDFDFEPDEAFFEKHGFDPDEDIAVNAGSGYELILLNDTNLTGVARITRWQPVWNVYACDNDGNVSKIVPVVDDGVASVYIPQYRAVFVTTKALKGVTTTISMPAATTTDPKNPATGANDVVGVAAALAVVALVSGAAISLKK